LIATIRDLPIKKTRFTLFYKIAVAALIVSFLLYFSRTMIVVLFLMILAYYGYLKLNARGVVMGLALLAVGAGFVFFLSQYEPEEVQNQTVLTGFLAKVKNSYTETFQPIKFDTYLKDRRSLWPRWRAYEASLVLNEVDAEGKWIQGKGFGSTVDAGFELRLNGEMMQHLPTVHNGAAYVYMKTGLLGLLLYVTIFIVLYLYSYLNPKDPSHKSYNSVLVAAGFYMLAATMVVTGIFKPYMMVGFLIGGSFALKKDAA
jgi:O-antigen ligase